MHTGKWLVSVVGLVFSMLTVSAFSHAQTTRVSVGVYQDHLDDIQRAATTSALQCPSLESAADSANQMLLEYALLCHAFQEQQPSVMLQLVPFPVQDRIIQSLAAGGIDVSGVGIWQRDAQGKEFIRSTPLINAQQFSKGLYTTAERRDELAFATAQQISGLVGVVNRNWDYDWQAMGCAGITRIHIDTYEQMFKLVALRRADVLPLSFSAKNDFLKQEFGVSLYPIPGIKLVFPDSTHIVFSAKRPETEQLRDSVNRYLNELRAAGRLEALYQRAGILNAATQPWRPICPRSLTE